MSHPVGILTFHCGPNYGAFMQAWHLREAIRALGHDAHVVNYLHSQHVLHNTRNPPLRSLGGLKAAVHWYLKRRPFRGLGDSLGREPFTSVPAEVPWREYRGIIVGSDVVWDFQTPDFGNDPAYFGTLDCQSETPFAAYAASCGKADVEGDLPNFVQGLDRFTSLGVRDRATRRLVERSVGREARLVVDPTWLGPDPLPRRSRRPSRGYVLLYAASVGPVFGPLLRDWCRRRKLLLVSAAARCPWADLTLRSLHPFEWVDLIRGASATVISGLHGTLYSIKYGKPFLLVNNDATRQKVRLALERSRQEFRRFEQAGLKKDCLGLLEPDSQSLAVLPREWVEDSRSFLEDALAFTPCTVSR